MNKNVLEKFLENIFKAFQSKQNRANKCIEIDSEYCQKTKKWKDVSCPMSQHNNNFVSHDLKYKTIQFDFCN